MTVRAATRSIRRAARTASGAGGAHREVVTEPFWLALGVGFAVQGYKGFRAYLGSGRWNLRRFVATGGMPSSHAASVAALSTSIGLRDGFTSSLFCVTLFFSLIVMYDAAGLRRARGSAPRFSTA